MTTYLSFAAGGPTATGHDSISDRRDLTSAFTIEALRPDDWTLDAPCAEADPDAFFPEVGQTARMAKLLCNGDSERGIPACRVRKQCLAEALSGHEVGVWGGLSEQERRPLLKAMEVAS